MKHCIWLNVIVLAVALLHLPSAARGQLAARAQSPLKVLHFSHEIECVAFSPHNQVAVGLQVLTQERQEGDVRLANPFLHLTRKLSYQSQHLFPPFTLRYSAKGALLASASGDKAISIWNTQTGALVRTLKHPGYVYSIETDSRSDLLMSLYAEGGLFHVALWHTQTGQLVHTLALKSDQSPALALGNFLPNVIAMEFSGPTQIAVFLKNVKYHWVVELWDLQTGKLLRQLPYEQIISPDTRDANRADYDDYPRTLALSSDGKIVVCRSARRWRCWETQTGKLRRVVTIPDAYRLPIPENWQLPLPCSTLALSPDNKLLASTGYTTRVWEVSTGHLVRTFPHQSATLAFGSDSNTLATVDLTGEERTVRGRAKTIYAVRLWRIN